MEHAERFGLAQALCDRIAALYPDDLLAGGAYGSTVRGTDTAWSDLELLLIVDDKSSMESRFFIYKGIAVITTALKQGDLERHLTTPTLRWPFWMGMLSVLKVLCGSPDRVASWLEMGQAVPPEHFRRTLEKNLPQLVVESYGRILSCRQRGNEDDIHLAAVEVLYEINLALCLLNRRWVTHDYYQGLIDTFDFPRLPRAYKELGPALWRARGIEEIVPLATQLYANYHELLAEEGLLWTDYQRVEDVPL